LDGFVLAVAGSRQLIGGCVPADKPVFLLWVAGPLGGVLLGGFAFFGDCGSVFVFFCKFVQAHLPAVGFRYQFDKQRGFAVGAVADHVPQFFNYFFGCHGIWLFAGEDAYDFSLGSQKFFWFQ
jgi:hypothetical protein